MINILFSKSARQSLVDGVKIINDAVQTTLGPGGRNVVISRGSKWIGPIVTKDGVTVAREIHLDDGPEQLGALLIKQASAKSNESVGDGTSSCTVLAYHIIRSGLKFVEKRSSNTTEVKKGMDAALKDVLEELDRQIVPIKLDSKLLQDVATISGNDELVGKVVSSAFREVGLNGMVSFEPSRSTETVTEIHSGMSFDRGYSSPYFITDANKMECVLNNPKVLLFENNISNAQDLANFLNKYIKQHPEDPLLIIADSIDGDALYTLVKNRLEKGRMWVAVKTPGFQSNATAWMQDLSFVTGAKFITKESGTKLENVNLSDLGNIGRAVITSDTTTLIGSKVTREMIDEYIAKLKEQLTLAEKNSAKEFIKLRIAKLDGGVGLIKVGGATEGETVEKLYRYEDSIAATKAAIKDGVLPGGGIALLKVKEELEYNLGSMKRSRAYSNSFLSGYRFVVENLDVPFKAIIKNAGFNVNQVYKKVKRTNDVDNFGFNAKTGQFVSMFNDGIVDAAAVTKAAIKNAVSVAGTILTTEVVVNKEAEKQSFEG